MNAFRLEDVPDGRRDVFVLLMNQAGCHLDYRDLAHRKQFKGNWKSGHPQPKATIDDVVAHLEHAREVSGVDHIGLGGDYDGVDELPVGLEDVSCYPALIDALLERRWSESDCGKLASGNILRVMRDAEDAARRLQTTREPSTATAADPDGRAALPEVADGLS